MSSVNDVNVGLQRIDVRDASVGHGGGKKKQTQQRRLGGPGPR
jgi:hypothetical protein